MSTVMRTLTTFAALIFWALPCLSVEIPSNLSRSDREDVIRILGISTSSKLLSNPYPLGGHSGLEVGLSLEVVNTTDLSQLGDTVETYQPEFRYPRISIGKGLYNNLDVFFQFIPFNSASAISEYGGIVKWSFYQAAFLPISLSLVTHGSVINVSDAFVNQTLGAELLAGISLDNFALYLGTGKLHASGRFMSGPGADSIVSPTDPDVDTTTNTARHNLQQNHSFVGVSVHFQDLFAAFQMDRYRDPAFSTKLGVRF